MNLNLLIILTICSSVCSQNVVNFILTFIKKQRDDLIKVVGEDSECAKQIQLFQNDIGTKEWPLYMLDSMGKLESGILEGNLIMLGSYDECLGIKVDANGTRIRGQFCMTAIAPSSNVDKWFKNKTNLIPSDAIDFITPRWGICTLAACSSQQLQQVWNFIEYRYQIKFHVTFDNVACVSQETVKPLTTPDYIAMYLFGIILIVVLLSTLYDVLIFQRNKGQSLNAWMSFSLYTNIRRLFSTKHTDQSNLTCLYGIRVISMMWIVWGHSYLFYSNLHSSNNIDLLRLFKKDHSLFVLGSHAVVDTFFVISGCLIVYVTAVSKERGANINLLVFYVHRILRLTPSLAAILLIMSGPLKFFGSGPLWYELELQVVDNCAKNWWTQLLYINNYLPERERCFLQGWYISVDTQLYLISPVIFLFLQRCPKSGIAFIILLIISCVIGNMYTTIYYNIDRLTPSKLENYHVHLYIPTHLRAAPWLVGNILGHILSIYRKKTILIKKFYVVLLWIISLILMLSICYCYVVAFNNNFTLKFATIFIAFSRLIWGICTCWIIFSCANGYGGLINNFLSLPFFRVLSRLTYSIFVTHIVVIWCIEYQMRTHQYVSDLYQIHRFWGHYVFCVGVSIILTAVFESPVAILEHCVKKNSKAWLQKLPKF